MNDLLYNERRDSANPDYCKCLEYIEFLIDRTAIIDKKTNQYHNYFYNDDISIVMDYLITKYSSEIIDKKTFWDTIALKSSIKLLEIYIKETGRIDCVIKKEIFILRQYLVNAKNSRKMKKMTILTC